MRLSVFYLLYSVSDKFSLCEELGVNIVFDLGGVLFEWKPQKIVSALFSDPQTQNIARLNTFEHPDWVELDRGSLDVKEAIHRAVLRTGLSHAKISELMEQMPRSLILIPDTLNLIYRLKTKTHRLFCLSNMPLPAMSYLESQHLFWNIFDGMVVSSRVHLVKPDAEIYRYLIDTFSLVPSETVFIDDNQLNIDSAEELGIRTILFENPTQCEHRLKEMGCL